MRYGEVRLNSTCNIFVQTDSRGHVLREKRQFSEKTYNLHFYI